MRCDDYLCNFQCRIAFLFEIDIFLLPLRKGTKEFRLLSQELFKNNRLNPIFEDLKE